MSDDHQDVPAVGDSPFDSSPGADVVSGDPGGGAATASGPAERLLDGRAQGPTVDELQTDYGLSYPWAISLRGTCRAATGEGVPPLFEILFGSGLGVYQLTRDGGPLEAEPGAEDDGADGGAPEIRGWEPGEGE